MLFQFFAILVLAPTVAFGQLFPDNVGAPLPEKRTALLTAFSDGVPADFPTPLCATVFCSRMAKLQEKFAARGYAVTAMVASQPNQVNPPASHPGYFTIDNFKEELTGRKHGVVVTNGHAGDIGIAVEHFLTDADVAERFGILVPASYSGLEIQPFTPSDD